MRVTLSAVAVLVLLLAAGCGGGDRETDAARTFRIALVPKMLDNPVFNNAHIGAQARARELGNVEILWRGPQTGDAARQAQIVEALILQRVDGIAISCNEPQTLIEPINKAVEAGIPTITFDSDSPNSKRITFYGIDDRQCGKMLARALVELTGGKGEYAILSGVPGAFNLEERIRGAREVLADSPDMKEYKVVYCNDDGRKAVSEIQAAMQANPNLAGWLMVGGWPLFLQGWLKDTVNPAKTRIVAVDPLKEVWPYIEEGYIQYMVGQKVYGWGYNSVEILYNLITKQKSYESFTDSGVDEVTPENLAGYKRQWAEWFGED